MFVTLGRERVVAQWPAPDGTAVPREEFFSGNGGYWNAYAVRRAATERSNEVEKKIAKLEDELRMAKQSREDLADAVFGPCPCI